MFDDVHCYWMIGRLIGCRKLAMMLMDREWPAVETLRSEPCSVQRGVAMSCRKGSNAARAGRGAKNAEPRKTMVVTEVGGAAAAGLHFHPRRRGGALCVHPLPDDAAGSRD